MLHHLSHVLTPEELSKIRELTATREDFVDGQETAGWAAKQVKNNLQMARGPKADLVKRIAETALQRHSVFHAAAQPKRILRTLVSRYEVGMTYGWHVDDPLMGGHRSDLSFTLFLSDPEDYEGGALILDGTDGISEVKLKAGEAVLYPTGALHQVAPLSGGARLAVVGWVRSLIRRADQREMLFELDISCRSVFEKEGKSALFDRLHKTKSNLMRMWAED